MIWLRVKLNRTRLCTAVHFARNKIKYQKSRENELFEYKLYACTIACLSFISLYKGSFIACVASVSNRVIARKLERKQKNGCLRSPPPPTSFMFFLLLSQLSRRTSRGNACYAGYQKPNIPDTTSKNIPDSEFPKQNYPDSRKRIALHGAKGIPPVLSTRKFKTTVQSN